MNGVGEDGDRVQGPMVMAAQPDMKEWWLVWAFPERPRHEQLYKMPIGYKSDLPVRDDVALGLLNARVAAARGRMNAGVPVPDAAVEAARGALMELVELHA